MLGRCRSFAFLMNDTTSLEQALTQCKIVMDTLMSSATETSACCNTPPIFHSIAQAGVEEFRSTTKTQHRKGTKRRRMDGLSAELDSRHKKSQQSNPLCEITNKGPGRPRQKKVRRKPFKFPTQVNNQVRTQMLKANSLVRKGTAIMT